MVNCKLLNEEIKDLGITQGKLAEKVGVSRQTVNKWLNDPKSISVYYAKKVIDALRITDTDKILAIFFAPDVEDISTEE